MQERKPAKSTRQTRAQGNKQPANRRRKDPETPNPAFSVGESTLDLNPGQVQLLLELVSEFMPHLSVPQHSGEDVAIQSDRPEILAFIQHQLDQLATSQRQLERRWTA